MNGLEFARCTTADDLTQVLIHAAPARIALEVVTDAGVLVARGDVDREADYSPMTLLRLEDGEPHRTEVWPTADLQGLPVLLAGGEAGILTAWEHADDHSSWRWSVEFSNHTG
jgi:hypothetical protein